MASTSGGGGGRRLAATVPTSAKGTGAPYTQTNNTTVQASPLIPGTSAFNRDTGQTYVNPAAAPVAPAPIALGGGGGGGGGGAQAATQAAARPSLDDYIKSNFLYTSAVNENQRLEDDYDADTLRQQQETEAEMAVRRGDLQRSQDDASLDNAEDFASRGLGRSGLVFQKQDEINARGADQQNTIAQMLTELLSGRSQGRNQLQAQNRAGLNDRINTLTSQFNSGQVV